MTAVTAAAATAAAVVVVVIAAAAVASSSNSSGGGDSGGKRENDETVRGGKTEVRREGGRAGAGRHETLYRNKRFHLKGFAFEFW